MTLWTPRRHHWLWLVLGFVAYNLAIFLLLHVKSRYRVQFLPFLFLYAAVALQWTLQRLGLIAGKPVESSAPRWLLAAAGSALALYLAFGG